jgi:hypothetical protein
MVRWSMDTSFPDMAYRIVPAINVIPAHGPLAPRLTAAARNYGGDVILCHRDAEKETHEARVAEILESAKDIALPVVPVVPVRMLEAWLLHDEKAIRSAANNVNGTNPLNLPAVNRIEKIADPKQALFAALEAATGWRPQRLRRFNVHHARSRVTSFVDDFSRLRALPAFLAFEQRLVATVNRLLT